MKNLKLLSLFFIKTPVFKALGIILLTAVLGIAATKKGEFFNKEKIDSATLLEDKLSIEDDNPISQIIPPSPTVSELGKYGDIPVGMYTGIPNVSVPLYNLQGKDLSVPISLSYHASGIKVDQISSWVGLGWSLNAGGVISRTVRGLPDENNNGYANNSVPDVSALTEINANSTYFDALINGIKDGEPDLYHYNVDGISGKFVIGSGGKVHHIPYRDDIKLEKINSSNGDGWILTTSTGIEYHFGFQYKERTTSDANCSGDSPSQMQVTGWLLQKIKSNTSKEEIDFTYYSRTIHYKTGITETKYHSSNVGNICSNPPSDQECISRSSSDIYLPASITSSFGKVEFNIDTNTPREDVNGGAKLQEIVIRDRNNTILKSYDLSHSYFNQNVSNYNTTNERLKRLKLNSVTERSATNEAKPPYTFDYLDENDDVKYQLPPRLSKSQDHWGFSNGANNNTLIPDIPYDKFPGGGDRMPNEDYTQAGMLERITYPTGGFNEFEFEAHDVGEISKTLIQQDNNYITPRNESVIANNNNEPYPVDGVTDTETFTVSEQANITVNIILSNEADVEWDGTMHIEDGSGNVVVDLSNVGSPSVFPLSAGTYTLVATVALPNNRTEITLNWQENSAISGGNVISTIKKQTIGGVRIKRVLAKESDSDIPIIKKYNYEIFSDAGELDRSSGRLVSEPRYNFGIMKYEPMSSNGSAPNLCHEATCGYLGISSSSRAPLGTTQGSHIAYTEVTELYGENGENGKVENTYSYSPDIGGYGAPISPLTSYDWRRGHLLESTIYKNDNGSFVKQKHTKNLYDFRDDKIIGNNKISGLVVANNVTGASCPSAPYIVCTEENVNKVYYGNCEGVTGGFFGYIGMVSNFLLGTSGNVNVPSFGPGLNNCDIIGYSVCFNQPIGTLISNPNYYDNINIRTYKNISQWFYIESTTEKIYDENGSNPIISTTEYTYDEDDTDGHQTQPIEVVVTNSDGVKQITRNKYVADYNIDLDNLTQYTGTEAVGIAALAARNRKSIPIEVLSLIQKVGEQPKVVGGALSIYNDFGNEVIAPKSTRQIETEIPLEIGNSTNQYTSSYINSSGVLVLDTDYLKDKGVITGYDDKGNLLGYNRLGDIPMSVIWNEGQNLPIAKVANASHGEAFYTSFEEDMNASVKGKTGLKCHNTPFSIPTTSTMQDGSYKLSYWYSINRINWQYIEQTINYTSGMTVNIPSGYIDEVRFYPSDAFMTTYTYDVDTRQLMHINNENNQTASFQYDNFQRLEHTYDFDGNLLAKYEYNYQDASKSGNKVYNYIKTWNFLKESVTPNSIPTDAEDKVEQIQFMDGLGRPIQSIAVGQATDHGDIVSHIEYDEFGRAPKQFMPFVKTANNGAFITNASTLQKTYNDAKYGASQSSFAETVFDDSPLNRVIEQGATGADWQIGSGHTVRSSWRSNTANEVWDFENNSFYAANELMVTEVTDENDVPSISFTDKLGRTILSMRYGVQENILDEVFIDNELDYVPVGTTVTGYAKTYYIYDDFNRIEKVIPPEATQILQLQNWNLSLSSIQELIYEYTYDERGRLVEKKIPGAERQHIVYDKLDRVVLTQDGNLRVSNKWQYTKYDLLGRPIESGLYTASTGATRSSIQGYINDNTPTLNDTPTLFKLYEERSSTSGNGYTNQAFPKAAQEPLSYTYYDKYDYDENGTDDVTFDATHATASTFDRIHGQLTGTLVKVLDGGNTWLRTTTFYDDRGRVIQVNGENHKGGTDITTNQYDFAGRTLKSIREHTVSGGNSLFIQTEFTYDHTSKVEKVYYGVGSTITSANNNKIVLTKSEYDQIGQMMKKKLHSTNSGNTNVSYLQDVDYEYNIRGWLTAINNPSDMTETGTEQMHETPMTWSDPFNSAIHSYAMADQPLKAGEDGIISLKNYTNTIRTDRSWRKDNGDGTTSNYMTLVKHHNSGSWYVWDANYSTKMGKPPGFAGNDDEVALSREGDYFKVYVNGVEKHSIYKAGSSNEELIALGSVSSGITLGIEAEPTYYRKIKPVSDDLFAMEFDYTTGNTTTGAVAQYNGNISQMQWKTQGDLYTSTYGFEYDDLNRLINAKYTQESQPGDYNMNTIDNYSVSNITYDLNGNIKTLDRMGFLTTNSYGQIDQMTYTYDANQLQSVHDAANDSKGFKEVSQSGTEYQYDANGNMIEDKNKGITIEYNHLNLPTKVTFTDVSTSTKTIEWVYDAAGVKLYKEVREVIPGPEPTTNYNKKDYLGGIEYADNNIEAIYHSEGRVLPDGNGNYTFEYTLKDHLGNSRVTFADLDKSGEVEQSEILQTNHYYPFGMAMEMPSQPMGNPNNAYQYNGKELNSDFGLDWLDYGARWYDASIARWSAVDLRTEHAPSYSPYTYTYNSPIIFTDPDGKMPKWLGKLITNIGNLFRKQDYVYKGGDKEKAKEKRAAKKTARKKARKIRRLRRKFGREKRRARRKRDGLSGRLGLGKYIPQQATIRTTRTVFDNASDPFGSFTQGNKRVQLRDNLGSIPNPPGINFNGITYPARGVSIGYIRAKDYRGSSNRRNTSQIIEGQISENVWVKINGLSSMRNYMSLRITVTGGPNFGVQYQARIKVRIPYDRINSTTGEREKEWGRPWWHKLWYGYEFTYDKNNYYRNKDFRNRLNILNKKIRNLK